MQNNRLWLLMSRRLSGEASPAELEELGNLLEESPEKQYLLDILHSYFVSPAVEADGKEADEPDMEERFLKIIGGPENPESTGPVWIGPSEAEKSGQDQSESFVINPDEHMEAARIVRFRRRRRVGYAAAVAAILLVGLGVYHSHGPAGMQESLVSARGGEVVARPGARTKLVLPDGTQVWLNSNSKLKYAGDFNIHSREVELEGEAYFDVVKNANLPFIVHSAAINVRVLGTSFTIKSYPQDETIEATLLRGMIEVYRQDNPNTPRIILKPNEKLVFSKHLSTTSLQTGTSGAVSRPVVHAPDIAVNSIPLNIPDSVKEETSWMYNKLVFNGDSFRELAEKMERWYNVKIIFRDEALYKCRFGGVFADENVEEALNALQLTAKFTYKIRGNEIELYGK
jgi:transmembrane sensor